MAKSSLGVVPLDLVDSTKLADQVLGHRTDIVGVMPQFWLYCCNFLFQRMTVIRQNSASDVQRMVAQKHVV